MCHSYEWEMLKQAHAAEMERRRREKAAEETSNAPAVTPSKPNPTPVRNEDPVPV